VAGATIDHLVSLIVFLAAILLFISLFNQTIQTAILYQRHRALATECSDLIDSILLNTGGWSNPYDWSSSVPTSFGLQDQSLRQYVLDAFSPMRLLSSAGDEVLYNGTGERYSNVSWGVGGGYLLLQESDCMNYSTASKLLGVNATCGFQLAITPTVTVSIKENGTNPLTLAVQVTGSGFPLSNALLNYLMFSANGSQQVEWSPGNATTDSLGYASISFPISVTNNQTAYTFIAKAVVSGLSGIGYASREVITEAGNIIPFIENYANGTVTVLLAHKWGKNDPGSSVGALNFNATFYVLPDNFSPLKTDVLNSTGTVNYCAGKPFSALQIPNQSPDQLEPGFLIVTYWSNQTGNQCGMTVMPWGIGAIGCSVIFGGDLSGEEWVATDLRQVVVSDVAYQAKLALWSLQGNPVVS
jgi:hypothetical protein